MGESENMPSLAKASKGSSMDGGGVGKVSGNNIPAPMSHSQGYRKTSQHTIVAAGTTFIGPANSATSNNTWYKFPWSTIYPFINQDQAMGLISDHKYWKFNSIEVTIKNPLCIQELQAANGTTQAGTNMSANLYGFRDDEYLTSPGYADTPHNSAATTKQREELYESWHHNGIVNGAPKTLFSTTDIPMEQFCTNHPDVTQCGMGNGETMEFAWNDFCPYWRTTQEFMLNGSMQTKSNEMDQYAFTMNRWDSMCGTIGHNWFPNQGDNSQIGAEIFGEFEGKNQTNMELGPFSRQATPNGLNWLPFYRTSKNFDGATISNLTIYKSPNPIPNLYFALQPQIGSLAGGAGDSICQVQFEVKIHLTLSGRVPRQLRIINSTSNWSEPDFIHGKGRSANTLPLFQPIWLSQYDRPIPNIAKPVDTKKPNDT